MLFSDTEPMICLWRINHVWSPHFMWKQEVLCVDQREGEDPQRATLLSLCAWLQVETKPWWTKPQRALLALELPKIQVAGTCTVAHVLSTFLNFLLFHLLFIAADNLWSAPVCLFFFCRSVESVLGHSSFEQPLVSRAFLVWTHNPYPLNAGDWV